MGGKAIFLTTVPIKFVTLGTVVWFCSLSLTTAKPYANFMIVLMDDMGFGDTKFNGAIGCETSNIERMEHD